MYRGTYTILVISTISAYLYPPSKTTSSGKFLSYRSPSDAVVIIFFAGNLLSRGTRIWVDWLAEHNFTTLGIYRRRRMLKYSWNEHHHRSRSLLVAVSLSMVPIVYPVLHAHIFSSSSTLSRTPGLAPEKFPRSRVLVPPGHYACSSTISPFDEFTIHARKQRRTHVHVRTHARRSQAHATYVVPLWKRSAAQLSRGFPRFLREKMGKNRAKRRTRFFFLLRRRPRRTHTYLQKNHIRCVAPVDVEWCVGVCLKRLDSARISLACHLCRKLSILRIKCLVYLS